MRNISLKLFLFWTSCSGGGNLRYFLSIALVPFCSELPNNLCNYDSGPYAEHFCVEFGTVVREEMLFKDIYLELCYPFCLVDRNHLCNFGCKQICEIILNLDQWIRRKCLLKIFLIWSSGSPFGQQSETICVILVQGITRNNSVKLF